MTFIVILIMVLSFLTFRMSKITSQHNTYNILDYGFFISVIISIYTIFPSISYLIFKDDLIFLGSRVNNLEPTDNEVIYLLLISISLVFGIFISYKLTPSNYNFDYENIDHDFFGCGAVHFLCCIFCVYVCVCVWDYFSQNHNRATY